MMLIQQPALSTMEIQNEESTVDELDELLKDSNLEAFNSSEYKF